MRSDLATGLIDVETGATEDSAVLFTEAVARCRGKLLQRARRIAECREDAEDIVQEVYLKALRGLPRFRGDSSMETWLHSILRNAALEYLRNRKLRSSVWQSAPQYEGDDAVMVEAADSRPGPEEICAKRENRRILLSGMEALNPPSRLTIQMCLLEDMPYQAVAELLHVELTTIKSRVFRARRILHRELSPHFVNGETVQ